MPLADLSGRVACLFERTHPKRSLLRVVFASWIVTFHSHGLDAIGEFSRQKSRPGRHAPSAIVGVLETDTFFSESIDVGRIHPRLGSLVTTDRAVRLIVGVDV